MDGLEKIGYALLAIVVGCYLAALLIGVIAAFPFGIIGLFAITGVGVLFVKVLRERLSSEEDDYYSKNVDR